MAKPDWEGRLTYLFWYVAFVFAVLVVRERVEGHRLRVLLQRVLRILLSAHCSSFRYISGCGDDSAMEPPRQRE